MISDRTIFTENAALERQLHHWKGRAIRATARLEAVEGDLEEARREIARLRDQLNSPAPAATYISADEFEAKSGG